MGKASRRKWESRLKSALDSKPGTPWYESNLFWAPITFAGSIVLTFVAAAKPDVGWWWLVVAAILTSASIFVLVWNVVSRWIRHSLQGCGIIGSAIIFYAIHIWLTPVPPVLAPTAIFMECQTVGLPVTILSRSRVHVIAINKKRMERENWGFFDIPNDTEKETTWPEKKKIELSARSKNFGAFGYKCEVSNHGSENIIYLEIPIDIWFDNNKKAIRYAPIVSSLDVAQSFSFYIVNDCPVMVSAAWQDSAKVQTLREPKTHVVPLRRKYRNPVEQIMVFFPSTVQWVRELPCE